MVRIPAISYDPLRRAAGYEHQALQSRLSYKHFREDMALKRQSLGLQWARFGLDAAKAIYGIVEMRDKAALQEAKYKYTNALSEFIDERISRGDYEWVEEYETDEEGNRKVVGRRPNWDALFKNFEESYMDKTPKFILKETEQEFKGFVSAVSRDARVEVVNKARAALEKEASERIELLIEQSLSKDAQAFAGDANDFRLNETGKLLSNLVEQAWIRPEKAKALEAQLVERGKLKVVDHRVAIALDSQEYDLAKQILQKYTPVLPREQAALLAGRIEMASGIAVEQFQEKFYETYPLDKGRINFGEAIQTISSANIPSAHKAKMIEGILGRWGNTIDQEFKGKLNDARFSLKALEALEKEVIKNQEYGEHFQKLKDAHLDELARAKERLRQDGDGGREPSAGAIELAMLVTAFIEGQQGVTADGIITRANKLLLDGSITDNDYMKYVKEILNHVRSLSKEYQTLYILDKKVKDNGKIYVLVGTSGDKRLRGEVDAEIFGAYAGVLDDAVRRNASRDEIQKITDGFWTAVIHQTIGERVKAGPLQSGEFSAVYPDRADELLQAAQSGKVAGIMYYDNNGRLQFASPEVKRLVETVWSQLTNLYEEVTKAKGYAISTSGPLVTYMGEIVFEHRDKDKYYITRPYLHKGNAILKQDIYDAKNITRLLGTVYYDPKKKQWVDFNDLEKTPASLLRQERKKAPQRPLDVGTGRGAPEDETENNKLLEEGYKMLWSSP